MSAATVRSQLVAFLDGHVPNVNRWYLSEPWFIAGERWDIGANGAGAVAWPHIGDETETRQTLGAPNPATGQAVAGQKEVRYQVSIVMLFRWLIPSSPTSEDAYVGPLDAMIEGLKARLRSDPKAGTAPGLDGVIFQQSQDPGDLHVIRDVPRLAKSGGKLHIWQRVDTTVTEIITA